MPQPQKLGYQYSNIDREYLGIVMLYGNEDGTYNLPMWVTDIATEGTAKQFRAFRFKDDGSGWELVNDYRRIMLYDTNTVWPVPNTLKLGDRIPAGLTNLVPPQYDAMEPKMTVWDALAGAWVEGPDFSRLSVYNKADGAYLPRLAAGVSLPDTMTTVRPPLITEEHQLPQFNDEIGTWSLVADYRGYVYWTADGDRHEIDTVGVEPPADALKHPPATADES